jgi:hypothetical protein
MKETLGNIALFFFLGITVFAVTLLLDPWINSVQQDRMMASFMENSYWRIPPTTELAGCEFSHYAICMSDDNVVWIRGKVFTASKNGSLFVENCSFTGGPDGRSWSLRDNGAPCKINGKNVSNFEFLEDDYY